MRGSMTLLVMGWLGAVLSAHGIAADLPWVRVSDEGTHFVMEGGERFVPWGFNYDHDERGRLIEDYWGEEWGKVEADFREMKGLGANVVRVHLQTGRFMVGPEEPDAGNLERLGRLVGLAEEVGVYLDLTGLGCYHKRDVPGWYDELDERGRWEVQARFWGAVAERCAGSPAVFCYDLMNEPVSPAGRAKDWLGPAFAGKHFVQYISRDQAGRERGEIARRWVETLVAAIRKHDERHLVTVGLVPWSLDRPGLTSGFVPEEVAGRLDFVAVHLYPESGKLEEALETLRGFDVGKPVVVEETFPLKCSAEELAEFLREAGSHADGWVGFYWGRTPEELRGSETIGDALTLGWLELFREGPPLARGDSR